MKDPQAERLYNAQEHAFTTRKRRVGPFTTVRSFESPLRSMNEVLRFSSRIVRSRWWTERGGPSYVELHHETEWNGSARAYRWSFDRDSADVWLPRWAWNKPIVLHELAHLIATRGQPHGPTFAGVLLEMHELFVGKRSAKKLSAAFEKRGVRIA